MGTGSPYFQGTSHHTPQLTTYLESSLFAMQLTLAWRLILAGGNFRGLLQHLSCT